MRRAGIRTAPAPWTRRTLLGWLGATCLQPPPARATAEPFGRIEAGFAARLDGPDALAAALGLGAVRPGPDTGSSYRQFLADGPAGQPFAGVEMRLSRSGPDGLAVLTVRAGSFVRPDTVRARYGPAVFMDVRPELPVFHLRYPRPSGSLSFGFARGVGPLREVVLAWGGGHDDATGHAAVDDAAPGCPRPDRSGRSKPRRSGGCRPWWVVLGTSPAPDATGLAFPAARRAGEAARRCGLETMGDFSAKFTGFAPDLYVTVAGGYPTRAEAVAALERARPCVPGAYLKRGVHAGG